MSLLMVFSAVQVEMQLGATPAAAVPEALAGTALTRTTADAANKPEKSRFTFFLDPFIHLIPSWICHHPLATVTGSTE
jgi:hypothetical protein